MNPLGVRWTLGDVSPLGFEALRYSIWGAYKLFGAGAEYVVCVNTIQASEAAARVGHVPERVIWHQADAHIPEFLRPHLEGGLAEGVAWKFAPLRYFPDRYELALDNDCILWDLPEAISRWLEDDNNARCVIASDVAPALGEFSRFCDEQCLNSGIRGLPPVELYDHESAMKSFLERHPILLRSELDEQGLQMAAIMAFGKPWMVSTAEVSICSPWPPHSRKLGACGAHFVGLNGRKLSWDWEGRNAIEFTYEHFDAHRPELEQRVMAPSARASLI